MQIKGKEKFLDDSNKRKIHIDRRTLNTYIILNTAKDASSLTKKIFKKSKKQVERIDYYKEMTI